MRIIAFLIALTSILLDGNAQSGATPYIEVSGTVTLNIAPDRITVEIGMEEYFKYKVSGDSSLVKIAQIEKDVRKVLNKAGIRDSAISVSDVGNYRDRWSGDKFKMAKSLTAVLTSFNQLNEVSSSLGTDGITSFRITGMDNAEMDFYNRRGLKEALDAARVKAEIIAGNEGLTILSPLEIVETTQSPYGTPMFSNAVSDNGAGMDNIRRITRQYSVKVKYGFVQRQDNTGNQNA